MVKENVNNYNSVQIHRRNGGAIQKDRKEYILGDMKKLINSGEMFNYTENDLMERYKIAKLTVRKYLGEVRNSIDPYKIQEIKICLKENYENIITKLVKSSFESQNSKEMRENMKVLVLAQSKYAEFLSKFRTKIFDTNKLKNKREQDINSILDEEIMRIKIEIDDCANLQNTLADENHISKLRNDLMRLIEIRYNIGGLNEDESPKNNKLTDVFKTLQTKNS